DTLFDEGQCIVSLILQTAYKRTYVGGASLHSHVCLLQCIDEVNVDEQSLFPEHVAGTHAFKRHRYLEYRLLWIQSEITLASRFVEHFCRSVAKRFDLQNGHHLGKFHDQSVDVCNAAPMHEGWSSSEAGQKA